MISMVRIDDRLIHGQVAVMWSKELGVDRIVVANDKVAGNEIQKSALMLAAPSSVKAAIVPVKKALGIVNDPRAAEMKILVLVNNPADMKTILDGIDAKPKLNISNYGRKLGGGDNDKVEITNSVYLDDNDKKVFREIFETGQDVFYQPVPGNTPESMKKLIHS
jgi:PTS system mannose-specific IIB component